MDDLRHILSGPECFAYLIFERISVVKSVRKVVLLSGTASKITSNTLIDMHNRRQKTTARAAKIQCVHFNN